MSEATHLQLGHKYLNPHYQHGNLNPGQKNVNHQSYLLKSEHTHHQPTQNPSAQMVNIIPPHHIRSSLVFPINRKVPTFYPSRLGMCFCLKTPLRNQAPSLPPRPYTSVGVSYLNRKRPEHLAQLIYAGLPPHNTSVYHQIHRLPVFLQNAYQELVMFG